MQFKVCGITDLAQAIALDEMKLNYIGFIFIGLINKRTKFHLQHHIYTLIYPPSFIYNAIHAHLYTRVSSPIKIVRSSCLYTMGI